MISELTQSKVLSQYEERMKRKCLRISVRKVKNDSNFYPRFRWRRIGNTSSLIICEAEF